MELFLHVPSNATHLHAGILKPCGPLGQVVSTRQTVEAFPIHLTCSRLCERFGSPLHATNFDGYCFQTDTDV